ncbi:MAG: aldose 1-epimerase [Ignavibacteriales bacterium]|nr:aldose 1-epimerase [Ignavibacteriales bacterium]
MADARTIKKAARTPLTSRNSQARSIKLVNFETGESVSILPSLGATVRELVLRCRGRLFSILEYPKSYKAMLENKHFAGVKLIPFPGRIPDATYAFAERTHKLEANSKRNFAIHGFFFDKPYQLHKTRVGDNSASLVLRSKHNGRTKGYPFAFEVRLTYTLKAGSFSCTTEIRNTDSKPIPVGDGWHPYFKTAGPVRKLLLSLPAHSVVEVTPSKVPTGAMRKPITKRSVIPLNKKTLDPVFDFGKKRQKVTTKLIDRKLGLELQVWQDSGAGRYRYLILHRPDSGSSVAIEPWTCAPNSFNNRMGLIVLKPGATFKASYGVVLKKLQK